MTPIKVVGPFPCQGWQVKIELDECSETVVSGKLVVKPSSIHFRLGRPQPVQTLLPMNLPHHPLFAGKRRTNARRAQAMQFASEAISHWLNNLLVSDNSAPASQKSLSPEDAHYISRLLIKEHLRKPCVKRSRKTLRPFVCGAAIVNKALYTDKDLLRRTIEALEKFNAAAKAFALQHDYDEGSFREYVEKAFANISNQ